MRIALGLFIAGGLCLSSLDAVGKIVMSQTGLVMLIWARYLGQFIFSIPLAYWRVGPGFWRTSRPGLQLARSTLLVSTSFLFFGGLQFLPLAEASAIAFTAPLWVALLSGPMLGERVARRDAWMAALGFSGILLIVRPGTEIFHYGALLIGAMAALNAVYQLMTRQLTQDSPFTTFLYSGLVGAVVCSAWLMVDGFPTVSDPVTWAMLLAAGLLGGLGHLLFVLAFYRAPPASLTPFVYLQMVWAIAFGWVLFGQLPDGLALLGTAVIIGSGLWLILHRHRSSRS